MERVKLENSLDKIILFLSFVLTLFSILTIIVYIVRVLTIDGGESVEGSKYLMALQQFGMLSHQMFKVLSRSMTTQDSTAEAPFLLHVVNSHGPMTQKEVARRMKIQPATLTVRLQRLEKLGYIVRTTNENDKRIQLVSITSKGKESLKEAFEALERVAKMTFDGLSDEEVDTLNQYIMHMNNNVERFNKEGKK